MDLQYIIIRPIITEKTMKEAKNGKCSFEVLKEADKVRIKNAVEKKFSVQVTGVTTLIVKGKTKRIGKRRVETVRTSWKKAVVTLKKGQKIDMFDVSQE